MRRVLIALLILGGCTPSQEPPLPLRYNIPEGAAGSEIAAARARLYCETHGSDTEIVEEGKDGDGRFLLARCHGGAEQRAPS